MHASLTWVAVGTSHSPRGSTLSTLTHMKIILHSANGLQIGQRHQDGYVNLTQMAQASGKDLHDYLRLKTTKSFLEELSLETGIPGSKIIQVFKGRGDRIRQGTWGHPQVAINCGQWCSPRFAVLISKWVVDWMTGGNSPIAETKYYLDTLLPIAKAYIENSQALNRTIHTAIHQQTDSLRQALKALESEENLTISNSQNSLTEVEVLEMDVVQEVKQLLPNELVSQTQLVEPKQVHPKGKRCLRLEPAASA